MHLLHEEGARHGRIAFGLNRHTSQLAQVCRALERVFQTLVGFVDAHRPLHGQTLRRPTLGRKTVRVNMGLQGLPGSIQLAFVQRKTFVQTQQGEVVGVDVHGRFKRRNPTGRGGASSAKMAQRANGLRYGKIPRNRNDHARWGC